MMRKIFILLIFLVVLLSIGHKKDSYQVTTLTYKIVDDKELKVDLYEPSKAVFKNRPLAVFVHGGSFVIGNRTGIRSGVRELILDELLAQGIVVASVDYRLLSNASWFPDNIEDVDDAVSFLLNHSKEFNLDRRHVSIWGTSAGGQLAMFTAYASEHNFDFVIDVYGVTDFKNLSENSIESLFGEEFVLGLDVFEYSPVDFVDSSSPETLIIHGTADVMVPIEQSYLLRDVLVENDVEVTLLEYEGFIHGLLGLSKEEEEEIIEELRQLIDKNYS